MKMRIEKSPLYQKAFYLSELILQITDVVLNEDIVSNDVSHEIRKNLAEFLREDSIMMASKVAGGLGMNVYNLQMEQAAIIRKCARDIQTHLTGLEIHGYQDREYLDIVRKEIDEFRVLFAEWVQTFDPWNYHIDRWGLFNSPGVNYDDPEPKDSLFFDRGFDEIENFNEINPDEWDELDEDDES